MRSFALIGTASLLALLSSSSFAGNVLLPKSGDSILSILGFSSSTPATPPAPLPTTTIKPPVAQTTAPSSMYPAISPPDLKGMPSMPQMPSPPAQVVNIPEPPAAALQEMARENATLPHHLSIDLGGNPVWADQDTMMITHMLGLEKNQIPKSCTLSMMPMVSTDKSTYSMMPQNPTQIDLGYDGTLQSVQLMLSALCARPAKLPNGSIVMQIGDKYSVPIGQITCTPPAHTGSNTTLHLGYRGDQKADCKFQ